MKLPEGKTQASLKEVEINSSSLHQLFTGYGVEGIAKAYPDFTEKDTVIVSAQGLKVRVGDLTKVFILKFRDGENADQFLQQVRTPQSLKQLTSLVNDLIQRNDLAHVDDAQKIIDEIGKDTEIQNIIRQHQKYPEILLVEPNYPVQYEYTNPNDPRYATQQWGLRSEPAGIECNFAWDYQRTTARAIGILDQALCNHEDLYFTGDQGGGLYDHGTAVAGVAGALTNNSIGIAGVVWGPLLRSYDNSGTAEGTANAIYRALGSCGIMNLSCGTYSESFELGTAMRSALNGGVLMVCSAGNDGSSAPLYPALWGFSVGATGYPYGLVTDYSNSNPDVVAPGGNGPPDDGNDIMTLTTVDPWYWWTSGTSFSAPFVTGTAGLLSGYLYSNFYNQTRDDLERILEITARDIPPSGYDHRAVWGKINANNAIKKVLKSGHYRIKYESASNRDWEEQSDYCAMTLVNVPGLATQTYIVKRYTCFKNVNWQHPCHEVPYVWVNEPATYGYSYACPNYGTYWGDIVDGSPTTTGATLKTNVYHIWDFEGYDCGWRPCHTYEVSYNYSVLGKFNLFTPSISSQLIYDGGTDHYIRITWSDTNEYHDGYQLYLEDYWTDIIDLPPDCHTYNYPCPWGSYNVTAKVRAVIGDSVFSSWSNVTTTRNAPNIPSDLRVAVKHVCGWPVYAKLTPDAVDNALCDGEVEKYWVSADSTLNLTIAPGHDDHDDDPPCFPTNEIKVTWDTPENQVGEPDYYKVRLLFYTSPPSVFYVGPIYGHEIEFCTWPNWEQRISVVAYKYGLHSNETEEMKIIKTGSTVICNDYPFGKSSSEGGHETLSDNYNLTPTQFSLFQNYPNPFNPETDISYTLPQDCHVQLTIYNMLGQQVKVLVDEQQIAGFKTVHWNGRDESGNELASGIYFYRVQAGEYNQVRKMVLVK